MDWDTLRALPAYGLSADEKSALLNQRLHWLDQHHLQQCDDYAALHQHIGKTTAINTAMPALAARLFKQFTLSSIDESSVAKVMTSSGTSSSQVSRIVLDSESTRRQQQVLQATLKHWLGAKRLPMLIIDHPSVIKNRASYSARGAGIQGLSLFGHHHTYALNEDMSLNLDALLAFCERWQDQPVLMFGFTFMVWQHFAQALKAQGITLPLGNGVLFHSGGWKKLTDIAVSNKVFDQTLRLVCGESLRVHNFYGMVEQTGTIYIACAEGHLHCPAWSDISVLDPQTWQEQPTGLAGVIQLNSMLPESYPGHRLLTEDLGVIHGEDDCACGLKGKYFSVNGRMADAELRGCSDVSS